MHPCTNLATKMDAPKQAAFEELQLRESDINLQDTGEELGRGVYGIVTMVNFKGLP